MRGAVAAVVVAGLAALAPRARAQPSPPGWDDAPAMLAAAMAPLDGDLRACLTRPGPRTITVIVTRGARGATQVAMPMPAVGFRGLTPEERCLGSTVARATVPALPAPLERIAFAYTIGGTATATDPALADWRAPAATVTAGLAPVQAALAACDRQPRVVRLNVDLRRGRTRVWLPAWQFHAASHDGSTPARQRKVKQCLTRALRTVVLPPLPARTLGDLQLAVPTTPAP